LIYIYSNIKQREKQPNYNKNISFFNQRVKTDVCFLRNHVFVAFGGLKPKGLKPFKTCLTAGVKTPQLAAG